MEERTVRTRQVDQRTNNKDNVYCTKQGQATVRYLNEQVVRHGGVAQAKDEAALHQQLPGDALGLQTLADHLLHLGSHEGGREHHLAVELEVALAGNKKNERIKGQKEISE